MDIALFLVATSLGGFMQAMTGIGYGMIVMGLGALVLPYIHVLAAIKILGLLFIFPVLVHYRDKIRWNILVLPLLFTIPGNQVALRMLVLLEDRTLTIMLGGIIMITGVFFLVVNKSFSIKPSLVTGGIAGLIVGFLSGISSISGPALALYYLNIEELSQDKDAYYATTLTTFHFAGLYQIFTLLLKGIFPVESWYLILVGFIPTLLGIYFGGKLFTKINMEGVRRAIYMFMVVVGFLLVILNILS